MEKTKDPKNKETDKERILKGKEPQWMTTLKKILKDCEVVKVEKSK